MVTTNFSVLNKSDFQKVYDLPTISQGISCIDKIENGQIFKCILAKWLSTTTPFIEHTTIMFC